MTQATRRIRFPFTSIVLLTASCCVVAACSTYPLVLNPVIKPLDFAPQQRYEPLHVMSFVDQTQEEERGFGELRKTFRDPPTDALNDALLSSLRQSQGFEFVDRNQPAIDSGYILEGRLIALETDESFWKFGFVKSTMGISAACVTEFTLKDANTGEVLFEQTVTSNGEGSARFYGGGGGATTTFDSSGNVSHGTSAGGGSYDSTQGYENSMSAAISENVSTITALVLTELRRRAELEAEATAAAGPAETPTSTAATTPEGVADSQADPPAVGAPAQE